MLKSKKAFCWIFLISMCKSIGDFIFAESFRDHESQLRCWPRPQQGLEVKTSGVGGICWWRWSFRWIFWGFARCFDDVCRWNNHLKHYDHLAFFGQLWHVFSLKFETSIFPSLFTWSFRWLCWSNIPWGFVGMAVCRIVSQLFQLLCKTDCDRQTSARALAAVFFTFCCFRYWAKGR